MSECLYILIRETTEEKAAVMFSRLQQQMLGVRLAIGAVGKYR
jgi:hypothetical protein